MVIGTKQWLWLIAAWAVGTLVLLPSIARPMIGIGLVAAVAAVWLASKSVAYPLAFAFVPSLIDAINGSDPLPKGGVTFLFTGWIALAVLLTMIRGRDRAANRRALMSAPVILAFTLFVLMVVRLGASAAPSYGSTKVQLYIANNLVFIIGGAIVGARRADLRLFFTLLLAIAAAGAILLMAQLVTGTGHETLANRFSFTSQLYPIQLGRSSANGLLLAIYTMIAARSTSLRLAAVALLPILLVSLLAAGSRGPVVAFILGVLALVGLMAGSLRARRRLGRLVGVVLLAIVFVPLVVPGSTIGRALSDVSTNGRAGLWGQAIGAFASHPLLGVGTGGFEAINARQFYPHDILLEAAVELGILGAILIVALIVSSFRRLLALWRTRDDAWKLDISIVIGLFVAALVNALFSGAFQDNRELWLWAGIGAGMAAVRASAIQRRSRGLSPPSAVAISNEHPPSNA